MYKFYIAGVLLPIAPQSLSIEVDNKDTEIELANGGVMTVLNSPGLSKYSFTFRAPNKPYPFAMYNKGYIEAPAFLSLLENLKTSQKPFMFKVIRGDKYVEHRDINALVSLESYTLNEDAENGGDYMIDVDLKSYIPYKTYKVQLNGKDAITIDTTIEREIDENIIPYDIKQSYYTVHVNEKFHDISRKFFGTGSYAEAIAKHNSMDFTTDILEEGLIISMDKESIEKIANKIDAENKAKQEKEITEQMETIVEEVKEVTSRE